MGLNKISNTSSLLGLLKFSVSGFLTQPWNMESEKACLALFCHPFAASSKQKLPIGDTYPLGVASWMMLGVKICQIKNMWSYLLWWPLINKRVAKSSIFTILSWTCQTRQALHGVWSKGCLFLNGLLNGLFLNGGGAFNFNLHPRQL